MKHPVPMAFASVVVQFAAAFILPGSNTTTGLSSDCSLLRLPPVSHETALVWLNPGVGDQLMLVS